jgi:BAR domain
VEAKSVHNKYLIKAQALVEFGDVLKQMADVKYALDDNVKQNFLEPLHQLQMKDLKEVMVRMKWIRVNVTHAHLFYFIFYFFIIIASS